MSAPPHGPEGHAPAPEPSPPAPSVEAWTGEATETPEARDEPGCFQVVMSDVMRADFEYWLRVRGLHLFPIPVTDDLPTYGIGITNWPPTTPNGDTRP